MVRRLTQAWDLERALFQGEYQHICVIIGQLNVTSNWEIASLVNSAPSGNSEYRTKYTAQDRSCDLALYFLPHIRLDRAQ